MTTHHQLPTAADFHALEGDFDGAVSVYLETSPTPAGRERAQVALKSGFDTALRRLEEHGVDRGVREQIVAGRDAILGDGGLWGTLSRSLAVFVAPGVAEVFVLQSSSGLWTVVVGWFLLNAARVEQARYASEAALGTMPVAAAMDPNPASVSTWSTIAEAVRGPLAQGTHAVVPVLDWNQDVAGLLTMAHVKHVPADRWESTTVSEVMASAKDLPTTTPSEQITSVLGRLQVATGGLALVLDGGHLVGVLTPDGVQRAIATGASPAGA